MPVSGFCISIISASICKAWKVAFIEQIHQLCTDTQILYHSPRKKKKEKKMDFGWRPNNKGSASGLQIITRQDLRRAAGKAHCFAPGLSKKYKHQGDEKGPSFEKAQPHWNQASEAGKGSITTGTSIYMWERHSPSLTLPDNSILKVQEYPTCAQDGWAWDMLTSSFHVMFS